MTQAKKPTITEEEAAAQFVLTILSRVHNNWASVIETTQSILTRFLHTDVTEISDSFARFEFALAAISIEMHALNNLFEVEVTKRIRGYIFAPWSRDEEVGLWAKEAVLEYECAWDKAMDALGDPPFVAVAGLLLQRLELDATFKKNVTFKIPKEDGEEVFYDPGFVLALGGDIVQLASGWWKSLLSEFDVTS